MGSEIETGRGGAVNGNRYADGKAMPESVREMYAVAMQCIETGKGTRAGRPPAFPDAPAPQGPPSRGLMLGGLLLCLFVSLLLLLLPR